MVVVYVLDVPEFLPIVEAARRHADWSVTLNNGYHRIEAPNEIVLHRKEMQMKPAVWYGLFTGGLDGEIVEFGRETVRVVGTNRPL